VGKGGFGLVYKATNRKTNEDVAIKMIKKDKMSEADMDYHRKEIDALKLC